MPDERSPFGEAAHDGLDEPVEFAACGPIRGSRSTCGQTEWTRLCRRFGVDQPSGVDPSIAAICSITDNLS